MRSCPATPDCVTFGWVADDFPPCPTQCGQQTSLQQRAVACEGSDGSVVPSACAADSAPPARRACPGTGSCVSYAWAVTTGVFPPPCSTECGQNASLATRDVWCAGDDGSIDRSARNCSAADRPAASHACPPTARCVRYAWVAEPPTFPELSLIHI